MTHARMKVVAMALTVLAASFALAGCSSTPTPTGGYPGGGMGVSPGTGTGGTGGMMGGSNGTTGTGGTGYGY